MKGFILVLSLVAIIAGGMYYTFSSKSYVLSREAQKQYDQGNYPEAYVLVKEAMKFNKFNREAIALRPKLRRIVEGADSLDEANRLYQDALNKALAGDVASAKLEMSQAYTIAQKITGLSPSKPAAKELMKKIERDTELVINKAPEMQYNNAVKYIGEGNLIRGYEALSNINPRTGKVKNKMSEVAYQLGLQRYESITGGSVSNSLINDATYWFSNVEPADPNFTDANMKIEELKKMKIK